jgi:hypothetical protein
MVIAYCREIFHRPSSNVTPFVPALLMDRRVFVLVFRSTESRSRDHMSICMNDGLQIRYQQQQSIVYGRKQFIDVIAAVRKLFHAGFPMTACDALTLTYRCLLLASTAGRESDVTLTRQYP